MRKLRFNKNNIKVAATSVLAATVLITSVAIYPTASSAVFNKEPIKNSDTTNGLNSKSVKDKSYVPPKLSIKSYEKENETYREDKIKDDERDNREEESYDKLEDMKVQAVKEFQENKARNSNYRYDTSSLLGPSSVSKSVTANGEEVKLTGRDGGIVQGLTRNQYDILKSAELLLYSPMNNGSELVDKVFLDNVKKKKISKEELKPGDVFIFTNGSNKDKGINIDKYKAFIVQEGRVKVVNKQPFNDKIEYGVRMW